MRRIPALCRRGSIRGKTDDPESVDRVETFHSVQSMRVARFRLLEKAYRVSYSVGRQFRLREVYDPSRLGIPTASRFHRNRETCAVIQ